MSDANKPLIWDLGAFADDDLVVEAVACAFIGGRTSPIHRSSLWRGIRSGAYPSPLRVGVGTGTNRWRVAELREVVRRADAARGGRAA